MEHFTAIEVAARLRKSEKTIRTWLKAGRFPGAIKQSLEWSIPDADIKKVEAELRRKLTGNEPDYAGQIVALEARVEALERKMEEKENRTIPAPILYREPVIRPEKLPAPPTSISLPPGYIAMADFTHHIPSSTHLRWSKEHATPGAPGWHDSRGYPCSYALSPEQQRAYYRHFSQPKYRENFRHCERCPHEASAPKEEPEV